MQNTFSGVTFVILYSEIRSVVILRKRLFLAFYIDFLKYEKKMVHVISSFCIDSDSQLFYNIIISQSLLGIHFYLM